MTGANGFVGRALCTQASAYNLLIKGAIRSAQTLLADVESVLINAIDGNTDWSNALQGINVVVHLAASVHFSDVPPQMRHFHQKQIIARYLTNNPKLEAGSCVKENHGYPLQNK